MKNLWKVTLWAIALLSVLFVLGSCGDDEPEETPNEGTHTCAGVSWVTEKEATCQTEGSKKFVCSCGKTVKTEKIPLLSHTAVTVPGRASTCTQKGLTDGKKCSVCGITLAWQMEISPIPHTEETVPGREATCKEIGLTNGKKCSVCGITLASQAEIPFAPHSYDDMYDATCNVCDYVRDAECRHSSQITILGYAATCTQAGLTDGKKCSSCGEMLIAQTEIPLADHTEQTVPGRAATCEQIGLTDGKKCASCGATLVAQTEIPLASHTEQTVPGYASTCTVPGMTDGKKCSVCGETLVAQTELPLASHTEETIPGYAATCTQAGLTDGKKCASCGETLVAQTEISFGNHNVVNGVCTVCGRAFAEIRTVADLRNIASNLNANYILMNDLDLGGMEWTPIGTNYNNSFTGTFDGNGHVIENFKITGDMIYAGLFGYSRGTIRNLVVENFTITVSRSSEIYAGGLVGRNYGTITNCYAMGDVSASSAYDAYAGGLVGSQNGTITNSYATGDVSATASNTSMSYDASAYAGGLVGYSYGTIKNCYATGDVSATASSTSTSSYASAYAYVGGLVGENYYGTIMNSYATGAVSASASITYDDACAYAGGLVGRNFSATIMNSYATGDVSASSTSTSSYASAYAGGLVGYNPVSTITNCYRYSGQSFTVTVNGTTTYEATNAEGTATDMATLQSADFRQNTLGWSAEDWNFAEGAHPTLKNVGTAN